MDIYNFFASRWGRQVWSSFRPGKTISPKEREQEGVKILKRCDVNGDGKIDRAEFLAYYDRTIEAIRKFQARPEHSSRSRPRNNARVPETPSPPPPTIQPRGPSRTTHEPRGPSSSSSSSSSSPMHTLKRTSSLPGSFDQIGYGQGDVSLF